MNSVDSRSTQWHVIYTRPKFEKRIAKRLDELKIEYFLPLKMEQRQWHDRKKNLEMPVLPNYVFVHCELADMLKVYTISGFVRFISTSGKPDVISQVQMERIKTVLLSDHEMATEDFALGEAVKIISGPFQGLEGITTGHKGNCRVMVKIDVINQYVTITVDAMDLEKVTGDRKIGLPGSIVETKYAHVMA